ncbi:PAS domain S-box protein [Candidatus Nitrospira bockiana]
MSETWGCTKVGGFDSVAFTAPITGPRGEFAGVVTARVATVTLEQVVTQTLRGIKSRPGLLPNIEYEFLTGTGEIFVDSDLDHKGGINLKELGLPSARLSESGEPGYVEEQHARRHVRVVTGYARTQGEGTFRGPDWTILVRMDRRDILAPVRMVLINIGIAGAVIWTPMLIVLLWATGRLHREWAQTQLETARARAAEAARRESEARTRMIIETALDAVIVMDEAGRITDWNAQAETMFGWRRHEAVGLSLGSMIIPPPGREAYEEEMRQIVHAGERAGETRRVEMTACRRDGTEFPIELSISRARVGEVSTLNAFVRDVTERKLAEMQLRENEERYRSVVTALNEGVMLVDAKGGIQACNTSAERMLGRGAEVLLGHSIREAARQMVREDRSPFPIDAFPVVVTLATGQPCSNVVMGVQTQTGGVRWISMNCRPLTHTEEQMPFAVVVSFTDISEQKQAEQRLRVQHAISRVLAEASTLQQTAPLILETISEPLGWSLGVLWVLDRHASVLRCLESWAAPHAGMAPFEAASRERTFQRGVGLPGRVWETAQPAWISDIPSDANFPRVPMAQQVGLHAAAAFPILVGGAVEGVMEFFSRDKRPPDAHVLALMATIGSQVGHLIERKQLEEQLRQSQKMEAIGRLAGGIAHDFNNLLTVITGYTQVALAHVKDDEPLRAELEEIRQAGDRAAALTSQLLAFSRRQVVQPKLLDLNGIIVNLEKMLQRLIGEDVNLIVTLEPSLGRIQVDPGQIEQVIVNVAINARDAMPKGGRLVIETHDVEFADGSAWRPVNLPPGAYVELVVSDTGCGMDEYTRSHMFEPFFTTKEHGKGTGLGLSTVYGIVKQSGGEIVVDTAPGRGTTLSMFFPRVREADPRPEGPGLGGAVQPGTETLLLVEDEPAIRALACDVLRQQGYQVLEARHGVEALLTGSQYLGPIHLLITDVVMPQMSGTEVAERLLHERPQLKVMFMSGYTDDAIVHHGVRQEGTAFLQKPFTPTALVRKVREVLDGP